MKMLNLGCGSRVVANWTNIDYALGARIAKLPLFAAVNRRFRIFQLDWNPAIEIHDLRNPLPYPDDSVDIIYTSHTLEHFTKADGRFIILECRRVLKPAGLLRIVVPDLAAFVQGYLDGHLRATDFVQKLGVLYEQRGNRFKRRFSMFLQSPHKCMYDSPTLVELLRECGFDANVKAPFESAICDIQLIEIEDRTKDAVIVEGIKHLT